MEENRPIIGITMGDPCGIGAEIIVKALADGGLRRRGKFVVFGFSEQLEYTADALEASLPFFREHHENIRRYPHDLVVLDYDDMPMPLVMPRGPSRITGRASMAFCQSAIDAANIGLIDAIVTAPISKTSWHEAGYTQFPGHTELLARKCRCKYVAMMFVADKLKVVLATIHLPLSALRDSLTIGRIFTPIDLADAGLKQWFDLPNPRIAVAGVNPHAGENGCFGDEEQRLIRPAIVMAKEAGINVEGPFSPDTVFVKALEGRFDCVVAMYHDQGLIPIKLLGWQNAVNLTLGLPIIRTSPDHGTAFDIAGKNKADPGSMIAAIHLAIKLAAKKAAAS